jgi:acyl-CoA thioester hydrolase
MIENEIKIRIRYGETDRMGYAFYGNYATYFEVARTETLRKLGINYKELEDRGIILPVLDYKIRYRKPAYYDDEITIKIRISEMPKVRFHFAYETFNTKGDLLNEAETTLVFVSKKTNKPILIPSDLKQKLAKSFRIS